LRIVWAEPVISAKTSPGKIFLPSFILDWKQISKSNFLSTRQAISKPATTPSSEVLIIPLAFKSEGIMESVVMSPVPISSNKDFSTILSLP